MILKNFQLSTLTSVALLTFSLNVFSTGICTPEEDIFKDEITQQEGANQHYTTARDGDTPPPETNEEYTETANENVSSLSADTELSVSETTGEILDEAATLTSEAVVETVATTIGAAFGPISIVVMIGLVAYNAVEVFENPNSNTWDKVNACIGWLNPIASLIYSLVKSHQEEEAFQKKISAINHVDHYTTSVAGREQEDGFLGEVRIALESMTSKDIAVAKGIMTNFNRKISTKFQSHYLYKVGLLQTHLKQLFAHYWIEASPKFSELIDFMDQSNKAGEVVGAVAQDEQWHHLTDNGRADSTNILGLGKLVYTSTSGDETTLNTNLSAIKSTKLDNTWLVGGISSLESHPTKAARYLVVTLRDTPSQDKGVEYQAYSIFSANDIVERINVLTTIENFENAGWTLMDVGYTATGLKVSHPISASIPSIITGQTIQLCGMSRQTGNFLINKTSKQMNICLENVFQDYKDHFAAYNLDDTVQINTGGGTNISAPFYSFLQTYGQSYNHLLAQAKVKIINRFYEVKKTTNVQSCQLYADNAEKFLTHVDGEMYKVAERVFRQENNTDQWGRSQDEGCWSDCDSGTGRIGAHDFKGCILKCFPNKGCNTKYRYTCDILSYVPSKDSLYALEMNRIRQQKEDEWQSCLVKKDPAPIIFARKLTKLGNFYLDESDSRRLFEEMFEGVRAILLKRFVRNAKMNRAFKN